MSLHLKKYIYRIIIIKNKMLSINPDIKLSIAWKEMIQKIKELLLSGGMSAIGELLDKEPLETIIESLPAPIDFFLSLVKDIPAGKFEFDADTLFKAL